MPLTMNDREPVFEFACHEGNYAVPNILGAAVTIGIPMAHGRLRPYAGTGYNRLHPRFQVHFINQFGNLDDRRVEVDLQRLAVFGGAQGAHNDHLLVGCQALEGAVGDLGRHALAHRIGLDGLQAGLEVAALGVRGSQGWGAGEERRHCGEESYS